MARMTDSTPVIVPPMLYLPVIDHPEGGQYAVVREFEDGRTGLLAYTALDRLADKCGAAQPWILVSTSELGRIKDAQPFDIVAFDLDVPAALRPEGKIV
jgi:hypothetical protein